jgi:ribonuclease HII
MLLPYYNKKIIECGCDEAGRGCLAGPVFAAAVIFPKSFQNDELNDSKQLKKEKRLELREIIIKNALAYAVSAVRPQTIDKINILNASYLAMAYAVKKLKKKPEMLLIDGNRFVSDLDIPHECIIKGDGKYQAIAAASILAKTYRDEFMVRIDERYPVYKWNKNKGYPTKEHRNAIEEYGTTIHHRMSFRMLNPQMELFEKGD